MKINMYGITKKVIRKIVEEVYGKEYDEYLVFKIQSTIRNRNNYPELPETKKYGTYIDLGGFASAIGYLDVTDDKQRELASRIKQLLIDKGFKVTDSSRDQYDETSKLGLGNGASFWFKE